MPARGRRAVADAAQRRGGRLPRTVAARGRSTGWVWPSRLKSRLIAQLSTRSGHRSQQLDPRLAGDGQGRSAGGHQCFRAQPRTKVGCLRAPCQSGPGPVAASACSWTFALAERELFDTRPAEQARAQPPPPAPTAGCSSPHRSRCCQPWSHQVASHVPPSSSPRRRSARGASSMTWSRTTLTQFHLPTWRRRP